MSAQQEIQELYVGYFGRAGDPAGVDYWVSRYNAGMSMAQIAQSFSVQTESTSLYPYLANPTSGVGVTQFLNSVYQNLFNRSLDAEGQTYWSGQLAAGRPVGGVILDIINGAKGADAITVANKVLVGTYYTEQVTAQGATWTVADDLADAKSVLVGVTSSTTTVSAGFAKADALVAADVTPPAPPTYTLSVAAPTVVEGDAGATAMAYVLTLDRVPTEAVTVNYQTLATGTATSGIDFAAASGSVVFAAGVRTVSVTVNAIGDITFEANETVPVQFSGSQLTSVVTATGTISNDDANPVYTLSANAPSIVEGNSGAKALVFELTLDKAPTETVTVNYETLNTGTATAGSDFAITAGSVTFAAGQTKAAVSVTIVGDTTYESNETVQLQFSGSKLAAPVTATGTITNDDQSPTSISLTAQPGVAEGETITLSFSGGAPSTVYQYVASGTNITAGDLAVGQAPGVFITDVTGSAQFTVKTAKDRLTEGENAETLNITVIGNGTSVTTAVAIYDTSKDSVAPLPSAEKVTALEGETVTGQLDAVDADGDAMTFTLVNPVAGLSLNKDGSYTYTSTGIDPAPGETKTLTTSYKVTDSEGKYAVGDITIDVTGAALTYTLSAPGFGVVAEGSTLTYTLAASEPTLADGTDVLFTVTGAGGGPISADLVTTSRLTKIEGGVATFTIEAVKDFLPELAEGYVVTATVAANAYSGVVTKAVTGLVLDDASNTPVMTLSANGENVNEGGTVFFTLATTKLAAGMTYDYTITGDVSKNDISGGNIGGTVTIGADGTAVIPVTLNADLTTEGAETLTFSIAGQSTSVTVKDTSTTLVKTFALDADVASADEGQTVTFTLDTENVAAGATYDYAITGVSAGDVAGGKLSGTAVVGEDGKAVVSVTLNADQTTEGAETLKFSIAGQSESVTVKDTSTTPVKTFALDADVASADEGQTVTFTLDTENVAAGESYDYTITGVSADDVVGGKLAGSAVVGADGKAVVAVTLRNDLTTEGAETLKFSVAGQSESVAITDTSTTPVKTFALDADVAAADEGKTVTFTLDTENVAAGSTYDYAITGVSADDVAGGKLSGTAVVGEDGKAIVSVTLLADRTTEGEETLKFSIAGQSESVTVNDTSTTPVKTFELKANSSAVGEGHTVTFTLDTENVAAGSAYDYVITGVSADDVAGGKLSGTAVVGDDGKALVSVTLLADAKNEGVNGETVTFSIAGKSETVQVLDNATFDLSSNATKVADVATVEEGQTVVFTLATENIPVGSTYDYVISGVSADDVVGGQLTGRVTIGTEGSAQISVTLVNDKSVLELAENLTVTVAGQSETVVVKDTSALTGKVIYLTAAPDVGPDFVGTDGDDTYVAAEGTLNATDAIDGGKGDDTLIALLDKSVTPISLANIETITATNVAAPEGLLLQVDGYPSAPVTLDLVNADAVTRVENDGSLGDITFLNLPGPVAIVPTGESAAPTTLAVFDTSANTTFVFQDTAPEGQSVNLVLDNVKGAAELATEVVIDVLPPPTGDSLVGGTFVYGEFNGTFTIQGAGAGDETVYGAALANAINAAAGDTVASANGSTGDVIVTARSGEIAVPYVYASQDTKSTLSQLPLNVTTTATTEPTGIITIDGIETVNIQSGEGTNAANSIALVTNGATTLNITGTSDLTINGTLSDSVNLVDATGMSGDLSVAVATGDNTVLGGSGNDFIVGAAEADILNGGLGNDTILGGGGDDSLEGGFGDDMLVVSDDEVRPVTTGSILPADTVTGSAVSASGGEGDDVIDFSDASFVVNDTNNQADNDTVDGGAGFDRLVASAADLVDVDNTKFGSVQTISGIEAITVVGQLTEDLVLSKIQEGIQVVTLTSGIAAGADSVFPSIAFDGTLVAPAVEVGPVIDGIVELASPLLSGADTLGGTLDIDVEGTGTDDVVKIVNVADANADGASINVFGAFTLAGLTGLDTVNASIATHGVETLIIDGTGKGTATTQVIRSIDVGIENEVKFEGSNSFVISGFGDTLPGSSVINAGTVDASGLTGDASVMFMTAAAPAAPNASKVFNVIGSSNGDVIALGTGNANINLGLGDDLVLVGTDTINNLDGDTLNGGLGGRDELRINTGGLDATDLVHVTGFEILGLLAGDDSLSQDLQQFVYSNMEIDTLLFGHGEDGDWTVTNAREAVKTISFIDNGVDTVGGTAPNTYSFIDHTVDAITMDRFIDADGQTSRSASPAAKDSITIETLDVDSNVPVQREHSITTLTLNDEEEITIQLGDAVTNTSGTYTSDLTIGTLNAIDLTKLTVVGEGEVDITLGAYGTTTGLGVAPGIVEVDASGLVRGSIFVFDATANVDTLSGSAVQLDITGTLSGTNTIIGGQAADTIISGRGDDYLVGGDTIDGGDLIVAGAGNDTIDGGAGNDTITGGVGADSMTGGAGVDRFVFVSGDGVAATAVNATTKTVTFGNGVDIITDFQSVGNGTAANDAAADIMVWNGNPYAGTVEVFTQQLRAGTTAFGDAIEDAAGLYWIQGTWTGGTTNTFEIGKTGGVDFMIFSHAGGILDAASLIGVKDIVIHDIP